MIYKSTQFSIIQYNTQHNTMHNTLHLQYTLNNMQCPTQYIIPLNTNEKDNCIHSAPHNAPSPNNAQYRQERQSVAVLVFPLLFLTFFHSILSLECTTASSSNGLSLPWTRQACKRLGLQPGTKCVIASVNPGTSEKHSGYRCKTANKSACCSLLKWLDWISINHLTWTYGIKSFRGQCNNINITKIAIILIHNSTSIAITRRVIRHRFQSYMEFVQFVCMKMTPGACHAHNIAIWRENLYHGSRSSPLAQDTLAVGSGIRINTFLPILTQGVYPCYVGCNAYNISSAAAGYVTWHMSWLSPACYGTPSDILGHSSQSL